MARTHILVVNGEEDLLELLQHRLTREGYAVTFMAGSGLTEASIAARQPDVLVLDPMLDEMDGPEACRRLRKHPGTRDLPIVVLAARGDEPDIVAALDAGADDCVIKPFSPRVLSARIKAVLRRRSTNGLGDVAPVTLGELTLDPGRHVAMIRKESVPLTLLEFRILHLLLRQPGWVFTRQQIIEEVQDQNADITERSVDVHIVNLRRKLGPYRHCIETIRNVGYRIRDA